MRKKPVQQRSQQVVEALIEATGQVIVERGLEHLTTIHVATRAGVSIGSLYQYFENKEALIAALLDRLTIELDEVVNRTVLPLLSADVRTLVRSLLHVAFDFVQSKEGLYLELLRNWFRIDIAGSLQRFEQNMMDVTRAYVMTHAGRLRLAHVPARSFVIINSVVFTLLRYFSVPKRPLFDRAQVIDELTAMIASYLAPPPDARRTPKKKRPQPLPQKSRTTGAKKQPSRTKKTRATGAQKTSTAKSSSTRTANARQQRATPPGRRRGG